MGDDGQPLIRYPSNFEAVSNLMTRRDLVATTGTSNNDWSATLFTQQFDHDLEDGVFEHGRYKGVDVVEGGEKVKAVERGLAEIRLLDRQLGLIAKKDSELRLALSHASLDTAESELEGVFLLTNLPRSRVRGAGSASPDGRSKLGDFDEEADSEEGEEQSHNDDDDNDDDDGNLNYIPYHVM